MAMKDLIARKKIVSAILNMTKEEMKLLAEDIAWYGPATGEVLEFQMSVAMQERKAELEEQDRRA